MASSSRLPLDRNLKLITWNNIWTALPLRFTSRFAVRDTVSILAARQVAATTEFVVPFSTVTVFRTTIIQTTFVTVRASTTASLSTSSKRRSTHAPSSLLESSSRATTLPTVITGSSKSSSPSATISLEIPAIMTSESTAPEAPAIPIVGKDSERHSNKTAIVGGLSGTIAGLLFIGILICLVLRRRRKRLAQARGGYDWPTTDDAPYHDAAEKRFMSAVIHARPSTAMTRDSPAPAFQSQPGTAPAVDEDHRMIRMSTIHWPRPFALGAGEGYRESLPAGQLRCTNPDLSRPATPRTISSSPQTISGSPHSFFGRQRSNLKVTPKSQPSQPSQRHPLAQEISTIKIVDPALSRECIARYSNTPSFKSYPSIVQVVHQRGKDDPFVISTAEEPVDNLQPKRPSAARTISAASRTWANIVHPLWNRSTSCLETDVRASSHYSVDTTLSSPRFSRRSDPFDLDRQSRNWNVGSEGPRRSQILYEGT